MKTPTEKEVPYALLEILVYGLEDDRLKIEKVCNQMQEQLAKTKRGKYGRILWYIDKGEKTIPEKKEWLIEKANSKYIIFAPETHTVKPGYVKGLFLHIKKVEDSMNSFKDSGLVLTKKNPTKKV